MTIPITGQPPVPSLSEPDTFNTKALNLFTWQTGSMIDQFNNVDPNDFFDIPALTAAAAQSQNTNAIINGAFDIWQRGTTFTGSGTYSIYGADRWLNNAKNGTVTQSRQAFPFGTKLGQNTPRFFLRQSTTGHTLGSDFSLVAQRIEGVRSFAGETVTVLGWARRASGSGNVTAEIAQNFGTGGSPSGDAFAPPIKLSLTGSLEPFAATITIPSVSGKSIGTNGDDYLALNFFTSSGYAYNARTYYLGIQTIDVDLWGIHILQGTHGVEACDNYVAPRVVDELPRCQRYCYSLVPKGTPIYSRIGVVFSSGTAVSHMPVSLPQVMRKTPSLLYGGLFNLYMPGSATVDFSDFSLTLFNENGGLLQTDQVLSPTEFRQLKANGSDCYLIFDAEL